MCVALVVTLGLAACGAGKDTAQRVTGGRAADALAGTIVSSTYTATLIPLGETDAALVDGSAAEGGDHRLVATWTVGGEKHRAVAEGLPPMIFPTAWWQAPDLYVFGRECPEVKVDLVDDIDEVPLEQVCGERSRYAVRRLGTNSARWSEVTTDVPVGPEGNAFMTAAAGDEAVLRVGDGLHLLEVPSGRSSALAGPSFASGNSVEACPLSDGGFLVVSTTAPPPGGVEDRGPVTPSAWLVRGHEVSAPAVPAEGAPAENFFPSRCLPGRGVLGIPEGGAVSALTVGAAGALAWAQVDLPGSGESARHVRLENEGGVLIAWESRGESVVPWRQRDDGGWTIAGATFQSLDPPRGALLVGSDILAFRRVYRLESVTTTVIVV